MRRPALLATILIALTACAPAATPPAPSGGQTQPTETKPFALRVGTSSLQATLDAHAIIGLNPRRYGIYETLIAQDEVGKVQPGLATEWKNLNPTTWQFTLDTTRKFSDGAPLTADDVVFSWNRAIDPANKLGITARVLTLDRAVKVDEKTVNLITKQPDGLLPKRAAAVVIMQKAWVEKQVPSDLTIKAVGTGPYMVKEFAPNDRLVLVPNPNSPLKPAATELTLRQIPDASARLAGLRTGELDLIAAVPVAQARSLESGGFPLVNFNQGNTYGAILFTTLADQPTNNVKVRQALNYAVDKDTIAKNIYQGFTQPTGQLVQKTSTGYNPNVKPYPYDVNKAKQLLAEAGYPNGFKVKMDVYAAAAETTVLFLFLQDQFKAIGVETEINSGTDPVFNTDRFYGRVARNPIFSQGLVNSPALDADFAIGWFSGQRLESERWYNNPEYDRVYLASTTELDPRQA